jgi:lipopolysaccharide export system protein LptC
MEALRETTAWDTPNHTYLLDGTTLVAYIKQGTTEPFYFSKGIKHFDKRGRQFIKADVSLFDAPSSSNLIEVQGSKGAVYYVDPELHSCTCPGYTFRGKCKHTDILVDNLVA